jgi:hypothetical protein
MTISLPQGGAFSKKNAPKAQRLEGMIYVQ